MTFGWLIRTKGPAVALPMYNVDLIADFLRRLFGTVTRHFGLHRKIQECSSIALEFAWTRGLEHRLVLLILIYKYILHRI